MCLDASTPDGAVRIPLYRRGGDICAYTIVDAADATWVSQWTWRMNRKRYVFRGTGGGKAYRSIYLHREFLGLPYGDTREGDHINRDTLDNRRGNLRMVTHAAQMHNLSPHRDGSSKYRGVHLIRTSGRWNASLQIGGTKVNVGNFRSEEDAGEAIREARHRLMPYAVD